MVLSDYDVQPNDDLILAFPFTAALTVTLPPASAQPGTRVTIKKVSADFVVQVNPQPGDLIDLASFFLLYNAQDAVTLQSSTDGSNWYIVAAPNYSPNNVVLTGTSYVATLKDDVIACNPTDVPMTVTLPDSADALGKVFFVKHLGTNGTLVTVTTVSGEPFDLVKPVFPFGTQGYAYAFTSLGAGLGYMLLADYLEGVGVTTQEVLSESSSGLGIPLVNGSFVKIHEVPAGFKDRMSLSLVHSGSVGLEFTLRMDDGGTPQDITVERAGEDLTSAADFTVEEGIELSVRQNDAGISAFVYGSVLRGIA